MPKTPLRPSRPGLAIDAAPLRLARVRRVAPAAPFRAAGAMGLLLASLGAAMPAHAMTTTSTTTVTTTTTQVSGKPVVEVAFVLDTTGSMAGLIEAAKRKIWSIATSIVDANPQAEIKMALVAYRDIGDEYVTRVFPLTTDIQDLYAQLLGFKAQGGGDWPESVNEALDTAVAKLGWGAGASTSRIVFLVGDAPPHMDYAQDRKYPVVLAEAKQKDIVVNAVQAGAARDTERVWREIAQLGNGRYIPIPQDGGPVAIIDTPYDKRIIQLQIEINETVIPYGPRAQRSRVEEKTRQVTQAPAAAASDMVSYLNKRAQAAPVPMAAEAVTGGGDLVEAAKTGRVRIEDVKEDDLPDALRAMPKASRSAEVEKQAARRADLNRQLSDLVRQRDAHLKQVVAAAPRTRSGDSFDRAVEDTLKAQIRK
jgi:von Willebrand factor type A domain